MSKINDMSSTSALFNGRYISPEEREIIKKEKAKYREYNNYMADRFTENIRNKQKNKKHMKEYKYD